MKTSLWFVQTSRRVNGMSQDNGGDDDDGDCGGGGDDNRMFKGNLHSYYRISLNRKKLC